MIYLDSGATTLQKPLTVQRAVARAIGQMSTPGRGGYQAATTATETVFQCRQAAAELFRVPNPEQVVFTQNATHGLNIAIQSLVKPGDTVLISGYEHNAVTRPLYAMPNVKIKVAQSPLFQKEYILSVFEKNMTEDIQVVICTQVSNVFGYILPIDDIAKLCQKRHKPLLVDASQGAGILPVNVEKWGASYVAMPGHKGLYGPQGTGLLLCNEAQMPNPILLGGTGSQSLQQQMPEFLPDRLEAGTQNIAGIAGLLEGIRFVQAKGTNAILQHERALLQQLVEQWKGRSDLKLFLSPNPTLQSGVLSFQKIGMDCEMVAEQLAAQDIAVRAGFHCAPLAHKSAGTINQGTVRISFSAFNTPREIRRFVHAMNKVVRD